MIDRLMLFFTLFNMKLVSFQTTLVCGYGFEFNIVSDLDLHLSTNQINLMQQKITIVLKSLTSKTEKYDDSGDERDTFKDSGLGSEQSMRPEQSRPHKGQGQGRNTLPLTPVDLLLTSGRMSLTLYSHEVTEKQTVIEKSKSTVAKRKNKKSKQDLDWRVEKGPGDKLRGSTGLNNGASDYQDPYLVHMYTLDSQLDSYTIDAGTMCIKPFLFIYVSQPHTVLSFQREQQKYETSCYDVLIKGAQENLLIPGKYKLMMCFPIV